MGVWAPQLTCIFAEMGRFMSDCLFCRIVAGEIPSTQVLETPLILAFRDIHPKASTHVLVIPKEHVPTMMQLETRHAEMLSDLHGSIQKIAEAEKVANGFRVVVNNGKDSGQEVPHLHYHVLGGKHLSSLPG